MATIRKRSWLSSGQEKTAWQVDYQDQHGKRRAKQFTTRKAAADFLATAAYEVKEGIHTPPSSKTTVAHAVALWLEHAKAEGVRAATLRTYDAIARAHVLPSLGPVRLAQLTAPMLEKWRDDLLTGRVPGGEPRSRVMAHKAVGCLKAVLNEARRKGMVAQNAALGVKVKLDKSPLELGVDIPTSADVNAILAAASPRWRPMILVTVFCGLRSSELRGLRWQDVDFERGVVMVRQRADRWCKMDDPKSKAGRRDIPMPVNVLNTLREWKLACPPGELVFPTPTGGVMDHAMVYRRCFGDAQRAAGIMQPKLDQDGAPVLDRAGAPVMVAKYGPHDFRHFCASWWIDQGYGPKRIMTIMGHASIGMTFDLYGHSFDFDDDDRAKLDAGAAKLVG